MQFCLYKVEYDAKPPQVHNKLSSIWAFACGPTYVRATHLDGVAFCFGSYCVPTLDIRAPWSAKRAPPQRTVLRGALWCPCSSCFVTMSYEFKYCIGAPSTCDSSLYHVQAFVKRRLIAFEFSVDMLKSRDQPAACNCFDVGPWAGCTYWHTPPGLFTFFGCRWTEWDPNLRESSIWRSAFAKRRLKGNAQN